MLASHALRVLAELLADPLQRRLQRPFVQPVDQPQGEEVLAAVGLAGAELALGDGLAGELGDRHPDQAIALAGEPSSSGLIL